MVKLKHGSKQDRPFIREVRVSCAGIDIFYGNERQAMRFASRAAAIHVSRALKDYGNFYLIEED
ncbi:hypothetical protein HO670_07880 [Streptococcus suis]|uniref:Uncharacterized protein n=1 Tax=Streptococcus suis TaxID=1307 RepID=A0A116MH61_STRSU|nr:hypothetical protein [Streptococcus suis]NQG59686.1 hypothetical protein [Streptococcus suis]NQH17940.1 hypothetical protein [Streptococcus suis]CYV47347.1 Uncharacterised protein [Streptococcus suis]CYW05285.1 Uncharacterised protein [Streptococcus suis]HEM5038230.1 hypothetical protein [Streptococcus suis]